MQSWFLRHRLTVGAGVTLFIVLILVLSQLSGGSQTTTTHQVASSSNPWFWVAALVLLAGAGASFANRGGAPARWALGILVVILGLKFISGIVFGEKAVEVEQNVRNGMANVVLGKTHPQNGDTPPATTSTQSMKAEAKWERMADGSIPTGVWSEALPITVGCVIRFDAGNGTAYKVQYRLYGSGWIDHVPKSKVDADEVRFIMIRGGMQNVPVKSICS